MNLFQLLSVSSIILLASAETQEFRKIDLKSREVLSSIPRTLDTLSNTTIPSILSDSYLYVDVCADLGAEYRQQQDLSNDASILMQIIISESQSGLNAADSICSWYLSDQYNCQAPLCTEITSSPQNISYPLMSSTNVTTLKFSSPGAFSIANDSWQLNALDLLYIHNCKLISFTSGTAGWIGLGLSGNGASNFKAPNPIFSFLLKIYQTQALSQLIFGFNSSYVDPSKPAIILNPDSDWKMNVSGVSIGNITSNFTQVIPLLFDVGTKKIILPQPQLTEILSYLSTFSGMKCKDPNFAGYTITGCSFVGNLSTLPALEFILANGTVFSVPPPAYFYDNSVSEPALEKRLYITQFGRFDPDLGREEVVILGTYFLSNYYPVFRQLSPGVNTITLYPLAQNSVENSEGSTPDPITDQDPLNDSTGIGENPSNPTAIVIIVIVIIVTVICAGFLGYKKGWWLKSKSFAGEGNVNVELRRNEMIEEVSDNIMYSL